MSSLDLNIYSEWFISNGYDLHILIITLQLIDNQTVNVLYKDIQIISTVKWYDHLFVRPPRYKALILPRKLHLITDFSLKQHLSAARSQCFTW